MLQTLTIHVNIQLTAWSVVMQVENTCHSLEYAGFQTPQLTVFGKIGCQSECTLSQRQLPLMSELGESPGANHLPVFARDHFLYTTHSHIWREVCSWWGQIHSQKNSLLNRCQREFLEGRWRWRCVSLICPGWWNAWLQRDPPCWAEWCARPGQQLESHWAQLLVWCAQLDRDLAHSAHGFGQQVTSLVLWFGLDDWPD